MIEFNLCFQVLESFARVHIEGVELYNMGQQTNLGEIILPVFRQCRKNVKHVSLKVGPGTAYYFHGNV